MLNDPVVTRVEPRVRANFTQNAKGVASMDITVEASSAEEMAEYMGRATDELVKILEKRQIQVAHKLA